VERIFDVGPVVGSRRGSGDPPDAARRPRVRERYGVVGEKDEFIAWHDRRGRAGGQWIRNNVSQGPGHPGRRITYITRLSAGRASDTSWLTRLPSDSAPAMFEYLLENHRVRIRAEHHMTTNT